MSKGIAKTTNLTTSGLVAHNTAPNWDFLYEHSTVKNPNYNIGDRVVLPDGRVFRYALAAAAVVSYHGAGSIAPAVMTYEAVAAAQSVGDKEITITETGITKDELRGGYAAIYNASDVMQWRGIIGNDASGATTTKIYLDAALDAALTTAASNVEVFRNPYRYATHAANEYVTVIGVPAKGASAGEYFWLQTWGPCIVSPGEDVDDPAAGARRLCFGGNYCLFLETSKTSGQIAGYYMNSGSTGIAGPAIFLTINP